MTVKCFIASVTDVFPEHLRGPKRSELFVLVVCSLFFLLHLLLVTEVSKNRFSWNNSPLYTTSKTFFFFFSVVGRTLHLSAGGLLRLYQGLSLLHGFIRVSGSGLVLWWENTQLYICLYIYIYIYCINSHCCVPQTQHNHNLTWLVTGLENNTRTFLFQVVIELLTSLKTWRDTDPPSSSACAGNTLYLCWRWWAWFVILCCFI